VKLILDISNVAVLCRPGQLDTVWIHTTLPSNLRDGDTDTITLKTELRRGTAEQWVRDHLGVTPVVITGPKGW
jgi:hypothetical protein